MFTLFFTFISGFTYPFIWITSIIFIIWCEFLFLTLTRHNDILNNKVVFPCGAGASQGKATFFIGPLHYQQKEAVMHVPIPYPKCIRQIPENFSWVDRRLRDRKFLGNVTLHELVLYLFFILAADKRGISFYSSEKIALLFEYQIQPVDVIKSRKTLISNGMIGFAPFKNNRNEGVCQVLQLPESLQQNIPCQRGGDISSLGDIMQSSFTNTFNSEK